MRSIEKARETLKIIQRERAEITDRGRLCLSCGEWQEWQNFHRSKHGPMGMASACKECRRFGITKALYGVTRQHWDTLLELHGGVCGLCEEPERPGRNLSIDHDHTCCGKQVGCLNCVRGLLCDSCNRLLGSIEKKPKLIALFSDYLNRRPLRAGNVANAQPNVRESCFLNAR